MTPSFPSLQPVGPYGYFVRNSCSFPAYLKFIDIWVIACVIIPFAVFILESIWELQRAKFETSAKSEAQNAQTGPKSSKGWIVEAKKPPNKILFRNSAKVIVPVATILFTFIYSVIAAYLYNKEV